MDMRSIRYELVQLCLECSVMSLLLAIAAVAVSVNTNDDFESTVYVNKDVVVTDTKFKWLPDDELRASWGSQQENGQWGFVSGNAPYLPVSHVSGSVFNIFDGDNSSGFVWKAVSLKEKCPVDSINCVEDGDMAR